MATMEEERQRLAAQGYGFMGSKLYTLFDKIFPKGAIAETEKAALVTNIENKIQENPQQNKEDIYKKFEDIWIEIVKIKKQGGIGALSRLKDIYNKNIENPNIDEASLEILLKNGLKKVVDIDVVKPDRVFRKWKIDYLKTTQQNREKTLNKLTEVFLTPEARAEAAGK